MDQLTVIDCSVLSAERGLIGASYIVDIVLSGPLDEQGMVLDFSAVKKQIKKIIDSVVDHKLLLPMKFQGIQIAFQGEQVSLQFRDKQGQLWQHSSPLVAIAQVPTTEINTALLEPWLQQQVQDVLPKSLLVTLTLREEAIFGAHYCYSHGLQKHLGACQRIAHGHRSRIEVSLNGTRNETWESTWAKRFHDIYLASQEHVQGEALDGNIPMVLLRYQSEEGDYYLNLPKSRCYVIDTESTVENIAAHIWQKTKEESGVEKVKVRAFEGVQKGAICESALR